MTLIRIMKLEQEIEKLKQNQMTPKQKRVEQIHQCVLAIANHFQIKDPTQLIVSVQIKGEHQRHARNLFVYHLHQCGMTNASIGRLIKRGDDCIRLLLRSTKIRLDDEDLALLASLPKVACTSNQPATTN